MYLLYGGISGNAALMGVALDIGWAYVETELGTNIVESLETDEIHLWPHNVRSDWNQSYDRVYTEKTHVQSVVYVQTIASVGCSCATQAFSGCATLINSDTGLVALNECSISASTACGGGCTGGLRPFEAVLAYWAGLFPAAPFDKNINIAVILKAREAMTQLDSSQGVSSLGSQNITSWHSMDYSESRAAPKGNSYIDDYIETLLAPYRVNRALALRRGSL